MLAVTALVACAPTEEAPTAAVATALTAAPTVPVAAAATPALSAPTGRSALPVFFSSWSADIDNPAKEALRELAELAKERPSARLRILGYTSPRGTDEANSLLARLRARVVYDFLVAEGVPANRLRRVNRGPTAGMGDLESRRVEVRLDGSGR
ncbi:OmpA family protein [Roseococcus sp. MDT2-1-1]|uniref:OmpA family protein n=2 Tax=Sabulicella glaciei TaxID=2984948 RepID=A0ABT3P0A8_9PROT|nr:OmpA family protein [Roseococcus sp. MDT2-1-1]MCW8087839.1 OmpA family protein [Roseococcus sp. MDT2-1-1]